MIKIRSMSSADWQEVANIYAQGIATGFATFETSVPLYDHWDKNHLRNCRLVATSDAQLAGWAALSPVSSRCVYGGVAEVSVYVDTEYQGKGIGKLLLNQLIMDSEKEGLWTLQSGIFPENSGSIRLHETTGFRKIGYKEKVGKLDGKWRDNLLFERRSSIAGQD